MNLMTHEDPERKKKKKIVRKRGKDSEEEAVPRRGRDG